MRGSTFRNAMVILDEAQNTTPGQMKMFLTRLGEGSRVVVDGDLEQSDLPYGKDNGLADALRKMENSNSAGFVEFTEDEITRDPLVREIVMAYRK
jgi:phosphate starvation-inducible PhoH-like protein